MERSKMDIITAIIISFIICHNSKDGFSKSQEMEHTMHVSKRENEPPMELQKIWQLIHAEGQWTQWGSWTCDSVCGAGAYFRKRQCMPSEDFGIPICDGNNVERSDKKCDVQCPAISSIRNRWLGQTLSQKEKHIHYNILTTQQGAFIRKVGELVHFECNYMLTMHLLANYSRSVLYWEKNGKKLRYDFTRMMFAESGNLGVGDLRTSDTGVYTCNVKLSKRQQLTMLVFSLIVIGQQYDVKVTTSQEVSVTCNSDIIGKLFPGLHVQWIAVVNNTTQRILKDYGFTPPENINNDVISAVMEMDTGLWICVVKDLIFNRTWLTNAFYVQVNLNTWTVTAPHILAVLTIAVIIIFIFAIICQQWRRRTDTLPKKSSHTLEVSEEFEKKLDSSQLQPKDDNHSDELKIQKTSKINHQKQKRIKDKPRMFKNVLHALKFAMVASEKGELIEGAHMIPSTSETDKQITVHRLMIPIRHIHPRVSRIRRILYKIRRIKIVESNINTK